RQGRSRSPGRPHVGHRLSSARALLRYSRARSSPASGFWFCQSHFSYSELGHLRRGSPRRLPRSRTPVSPNPVLGVEVVRRGQRTVPSSMVGAPTALNSNRQKHRGRAFVTAAGLAALFARRPKSQPLAVSARTFRDESGPSDHLGRHNDAVTSAPTERRSRIGSIELLPVLLIVFAVSGGGVSAYIASRPNLAVAATVFCGVFVQALPFLVLGVVISGLVATFVTPDRLERWLPRRRTTSILAAGIG